ncbi:MAG: hypothetical protein GY765_19300, partial [bacterium]|nr:hypothetical protein [bacterium]
GKPRNFELYWREKSGSCKIKLKAADIRLLKDFRFLWQSDIPDRIWMDRLEIRIDARDYVGKVRVEGFEDGEWRLLKEDAAVYKSAGRARVRVDFRPGFYEKIKLHFTSFNKKHQKRLIPIGSVTVPGTLTPGWAKDGEYKESYIEPTFKRRLSENIHELETLLPGSGLWVEALELETEARFQGQWKIGGLGILEGERVFRPLSSASVPFAKSGGKTVRFHIGKRWAGKSMLLKLDAGGKFLGKVTALKLIIRRPRFIFHADMPGTYRLLTGTGASQSVREWVGEAGETADFALEFKEPVANETWRPRSILDKYKIMGGPFNPEGFTWKAPVDVPKPGYYCFYLNRDASLETKPSGIRLVQSDTQVPFLFGPVKSVGV